MKSKKTLLKFGLISGSITVLGFFLWPVLMRLAGREMNDMAAGEFIGYMAMLVALSMVFFGVRAYRQQNGGAISFKSALLNGMIIVLIASFIYVAGWMVYYPNFMPDFADKYLASQIEVVNNSEMTNAAKNARITELRAANENYKKPHIMVGYTFLEIFPVGLVVAIISAVILRRRP